MDLEQYLEKDIITFLDGKIEKKDNKLIDREEEYGIYMARDYLKELSYALDNEELTKAKRLFDDLKMKFSLLPKNSLERKKVYSLLEKMYDKIQNYVKIKEGKIEIIKQGDSEVLKDTTDKFTDMSSKIINDKIKIPAEFTVEFEDKRPLELPISSEKNNKLKEQLNKENIHEKRKKHELEDVSVESKILGKHIEKIEGQTEKDSDMKRMEELEKKHKLQDFSKTESSLTQEMIHAVEMLLGEIDKKLEEKDIESIREEITKHVVKELDKRLDAEKQIRSNEKDKICKEVLDQVYRKAKHLISEEDNRAQHVDIGNGKYEDKKIIYIINNARHKEDKNAKHEEEKIEKVDYKTKYIVDGSNNSDTDSTENNYLSENFVDFSGNIKGLEKSRLRHGHNEENMQQMYEEAIYTMFQNDYAKAAKIFEKILRIRPENKAAKIRLYECIEAIGNA